MPRAKNPWSPDRYLLAAFRRVFRWSPERHKALARAFHHSEIINILITRGKKKGQYKKGKIEFYECEECHQIVPRKQKQVDHIEPVVLPLVGFNGYDDLKRRMFVSADKLKILCKACHQIKTQKENKIRRKVKKQKDNQ